MITYSTGTYTGLVVPNFETFLDFVSQLEEYKFEDIKRILSIYKGDDQDVRSVIAYEGEDIVGCYLWRPWEKSPYFKNNPEIKEELLSKGLNPEEIYASIFLGVKPTHRRRHIASGMVDEGQAVASKEGFKSRVIYFIQPGSGRSYKESRYNSRVLQLDYKDLFGDNIEIYRFA